MVLEQRTETERLVTSKTPFRCLSRYPASQFSKTGLHGTLPRGQRTNKTGGGAVRSVWARLSQSTCMSDAPTHYQYMKPVPAFRLTLRGGTFAAFRGAILIPSSPSIQLRERRSARETGTRLRTPSPSSPWPSVRAPQRRTSSAPCRTQVSCTTSRFSHRFRAR